MNGRELLEAQLCTYSNKVLTGNWWEDRIQEPENVLQPSTAVVADAAQEHLMAATHGRDSYTRPQSYAPHLTRHARASTQRCMAKHYAQGEQQYRTTMKQEAESHLHEHMAPVHGPAKMVPAKVHQSLATLDASLLLSKVLGETASKHAADHWETTAQHHYATLPKQAVAAKPDKFGPPDKKHFQKNGMARDFYDHTRRGEPPQGHCGARGPLTRNPAESGSRYGRSVFWDEYGEACSQIKA
ncbi:hypothetical protein WJX72_005701 [[Myrmecia] bisecta]|uniref:Flagellar associated protein n=1 Tax=[Myrmecia] bisecta TaxID=41462 RepID=A0AAW1PH80_9CHLO